MRSRRSATDEQRDRERVHADALVPAQRAREEVRDLGEVEAAERRGQRDGEREPDRVAAGCPRTGSRPRESGFRR